MDFSIRPYQAFDLQSCRNLWVELTQHHRNIYNDPTIGGHDPGRAFDEYLDHPHLAGPWVAEIEGQMIGLIGLLIQGEEADIEPIVVASNRRSRGIGQLLLETAIEESRKRGIRFLSVRPVARNKEAIAFFVKMGFGSLGQIELFQELISPAEREWEDGITIHGNRLKC